MFMANLSSADPVNNESGPSYDSDILSEVHVHDHYQDAICEHHEEHAMHDNVQLNPVVDSHADDTSDSNMILYDKYVKDNVVPVVHSNVSSIPNDAYMMIYNDMYEPHAQSVSKTSRNTIVEKSLTAELAIYKEQVELYERRAMFELIEREQKINEQLRLVISDLNFKEETLKKELHSVKLQLASTINHNKLMVEEVTSPKKDFKQKENKYLKDFLDMKSLKVKVEDRLFKQDQSLQTVHMLCRPKLYYNELNKIAEITRRKMNDKMKDPECVTHKVKIVPHDYSKENFLATFTPQKQLTPEQIFWSQDLIKMKFEALKEQTTVSKPIKALTVKHDEIKRKNLLIANDNLIAECLSKELFSVATNSELNVARFTEMHVANTIVEAHSLELEAEFSNLRDKSPNDNHDELVNVFPILRAENDKVKQHYKELYNSIKITHAKHIEQVTALTTENVNLKAQILDTVNSVSKYHVKPKVLALRKYAIDVEPIIPRLRNNRQAHLDYLTHLKESVETIRDIVEETKVVRPLDSLIVSACRYTKHSQELLEYAIGTCRTDHPLVFGLRLLKTYDGDRSRLMNFMKKFTGKVRFRNDHFGAIMGYGDYMIGNSVISRIAPRTPQQNGIVERWNHTLVEAARTMPIFSKALMFLWTKAMATACYTQNRSLIHTRHNKTPYELVHNKKPDLSFFRVFGALCYPTNDRPTLIFLTPGQISSGLVPNPIPATPYVPPTNKYLEILFQPMFNEYLKLLVLKDRFLLLQQYKLQSIQSVHLHLPPLIKMYLLQVFSPSSSTLRSHSLHQGVAAESTFMEDNPIAPVGNNPFINVFAPEPSSDASSSEDVSSTDATYVSQHFIISVNGAKITRLIM
nr:retrovirus-related Pol polyprotein from transposon TNT 1-94 [Tanacetum cinerariifolium]